MPDRKRPSTAPLALAYFDTAVHTAVEDMDLDDLVDSILEPLHLGATPLLRGEGFCLDTSMTPMDFDIYDA